MHSPKVLLSNQYFSILSRFQEVHHKNCESPQVHGPVREHEDRIDVSLLTM